MATASASALALFLGSALSFCGVSCMICEIQKSMWYELYDTKNNKINQTIKQARFPDRGSLALFTLHQLICISLII